MADAYYKSDIEWYSDPDKIFDALNLFTQRINLIKFLRDDEEMKDDNQLLELLLQTFQRESTDPLDKVYALLSLSSSGSGPGRLVPDYGIAMQELFKRVTLHIINKEQKLEPLIGSYLHHGNLPSWIANWSKDPEHNITTFAWAEIMSQMMLENRYNAALGSRAKPEVLEDVFLLLKCARVDQITLVLDSGIIDDKEVNLATCRHILSMNGREEEQRRNYVRGGTWLEAYWRTICGDVLFSAPFYLASQARRTTAADGALRDFHISDQAADSIMSQEDRQKLTEYHTSIRAMNWGRRPFITQSGYLGLGPEKMKIGDEVYVAEGSNVPFVFRKMDMPDVKYKDEDATGFPVFELVGDCYLHGIMDGEMWGEEGPEKVKLALR